MFWIQVASLEVVCDRVPKWPFGHLNFWRFMLIYEGCVSPTEKVLLQKRLSRTILKQINHKI